AAIRRSACSITKRLVENIALGAVHLPPALVPIGAEDLHISLRPGRRHEDHPRHAAFELISLKAGSRLGGLPWTNIARPGPSEAGLLMGGSFILAVCDHLPRVRPAQHHAYHA